MAMEVLSLECEKLSADTEASATFITSFNEFVEEHQLTLISRYTVRCHSILY